MCIRDRAWEELNSLCGLLKANGLAERVYLDFSVEGDMGYYSCLLYTSLRKQVYSLFSQK